MKTSIRNSMLASAMALALGACAAANGEYPTVTGPAPKDNDTPYAGAFECFQDTTPENKWGTMRLAVSEIKDYTGKVSYDAQAGGYAVTQGGGLMVSSALGKLTPAVRLVERLDRSILEVERSYASKKLLREGNELRTPKSGDVVGSDYYITGGITEVNYNNSTGGVEASVAGVGGGARWYVMNVAVDLRLVDSVTGEVVNSVAKEKQIIGHEIKANTFRFFGSTLVDINAGTKNQEPMQLGVRTALELATLELVEPVMGADYEFCKTEVEKDWPSYANARDTDESDYEYSRLEENSGGGN